MGGMLVDDDQLSAPFAEDVGVRDLAEDAKIGVSVHGEKVPCLTVRSRALHDIFWRLRPARIGAHRCRYGRAAARGCWPAVLGRLLVGGRVGRGLLRRRVAPLPFRGIEWK